LDAPSGGDDRPRAGLRSEHGARDGRGGGARARPAARRRTARATSDERAAAGENAARHAKGGVMSTLVEKAYRGGNEADDAAISVSGPREGVELPAKFIAWQIHSRPELYEKL